MTYIVIKGDELYHHGIKGIKWGVRRYQNADGSLKAAGRKRYTEGAKKQLTDEERAARNKKIAKTVAVVAGTAVVAAGAYAAHKYLKSTMSEADSIMNDEKKKQMDRWMDSFLKQEEVSRNASKRFEKSVDDYFGPRTALWDEKTEREHMDSARKFAEAARLDTSTLRNRMNIADRTMTSNIGNKKVRRAAQREIIKRDIKNAKLSAELRRRKARNNPMDRVSQDWARAMISEPADSKIRSLAIRGESGLKKRR